MRDGYVHNLASVLSGLLKGMDLDTKLKEHSCIVAWDEVVGDRVANAAQPDFVRDGLMFVTAKSPVWANELNLYKRDIIQKINAEVGSVVIRDIIFKAGRTLHRRVKATSKQDNFDLEGIRLSDDELERIGTVVHAAGDEASESMRTLLITAARLEKWKKAKGWTACRKCGALHGDYTDLCPVCSIKPK